MSMSDRTESTSSFGTSDSRYVKGWTSKDIMGCSFRFKITKVTDGIVKPLLPPASAVEVIKTVQSVCLSVLLYVC